jgi:hypothetical protein
MASCGLTEQEATCELRSATDALMETGDVYDFCDTLGLDEEDLFENPEALLAFM